MALRKKKIPNVWRTSHGCLTKQRRLLPGKGIFTENKKGMNTAEEAGTSTDYGKRHGKCL